MKPNLKNPQMIHFIDSDAPHFSPEMARNTAHNGLVAISRHLTPPMLPPAYRQGIFPWYRDADYVYWFATQPRFVLLPENLRISRSLAKTLRHKPYRVSINFAFAQVIAQCAHTPRPQQQGSWIAPEFQAAYTALHQMGFAHSFEYWQPENGTWQLKGGLYGVQIGRVFYGESMFAHANDASKIAFVHAVRHLQHYAVALIDCQQETRHLARFGAQMMEWKDFQAALNTLNPQNLRHPIVPQIIHETVQAA